MSVLFKFVYGVSFQFRQFIITWRGTFSLKPDWVSFPGNRWIQEKCFHSSYLAKSSGHGGTESLLNNDKRKICNPFSPSFSEFFDVSQNSPVIDSSSLHFENLGVELQFHGNIIKQVIANIKYTRRADFDLSLTVVWPLEGLLTVMSLSFLISHLFDMSSKVLFFLKWIRILKANFVQL